MFNTCSRTNTNSVLLHETEMARRDMERQWHSAIQIMLNLEVFEPTLAAVSWKHWWAMMAAPLATASASSTCVKSTLAYIRLQHDGMTLHSRCR